MMDNMDEVPLEIPDPLPRLDKYHPSSANWQAEVIYFLLPDRFDDGSDADREPLGRNRRRKDWVPGPDSAFRKQYWNYWAISGRNRFQGGRIEGIRRRLQYLNHLGVTAIWLAPVFRQRVVGVDVNQCGDGTDDDYWPPKQADLADWAKPENYREVQTPRDDYHGYAIQNFLAVDPRFGTLADLQALVKAAHDLDMYVIYDIVINHASECFAYQVDGALNPIRPPFLPHEPRDRHYQFDRWLDAGNLPMDGEPGLDDAVWPAELRNVDWYSRRGRGSYGSDDLIEYQGSDYRNRDFSYPWDAPEDKNTQVLDAMVKIWSYWIAATDCDGFRVDTYKHVPEWVSLEFTRRIREFASGLGKREFLIMGEIGGSEAVAATYLTQPDVRLLSLDGRRQALRELAAGRAGNADRVLDPKVSELNGYKDLSGEQQAAVNKIGDDGIRARFVMSIDDHDGLGLPEQRRIAGTYGTRAVLPAAAFLLFGPGIPCLYYGTEQALVGPPLEWANGEGAAAIIGNLSGYGWSNRGQGGDRYLREAMFGPEFPLRDGAAGRLGQRDPRLPGFGPMGTSGLTAFDDQSPWYLGIAAMGQLRKAWPALAIGDIKRLKTGRVDEGRYGVGLPRGVVVWSRLAEDGSLAVIVVNLTLLSPTAVSHRIEVAMPVNRAMSRQLRIVREGPPDTTVEPAVTAMRTDTGLSYLDLGVVVPDEIRVYVSVPDAQR